VIQTESNTTHAITPRARLERQRAFMLSLRSPHAAIDRH
jgi:hypothetical protein